MQNVSEVKWDLKVRRIYAFTHQAERRVEEHQRKDMDGLRAIVVSGYCT